MRHARKIALFLGIGFTATLIREVISLVMVDVARAAREPLAAALAAAAVGFWLLWWLLRDSTPGPGGPGHRSARR
jgi:putative flippase GtrA